MTPTAAADPSRPRVGVIGAGVGGLACAALLAKAGARVTLFERNARVGGKLNLLEEDGFSWDMGPSLLTMPHVFEELWRLLGRRIEDDLALVPLPLACRYRWSDGTTIDEDAAFWRRPDVRRFVNYAAGLYDISAEAFLRHPPEDLWRQFRPGNLAKLRHLPKIATFQTMDRVVRRYFSDPHLIQLFNRFATYNGSSPYLTPAAFNIIPYVEARFGSWYVKGGLYEIGRALERIARELGVEIRAGEEIAEMFREDDGCYTLTTKDNRAEKFDAAVCNQDALSALPGLLNVNGFGAKLRQFFGQRATRDLSISGFILYLGVARKYPQLAHHNIFFSDDYPHEFRQMFGERQPAAEPTIYVAVNSRTDPDRAPPDCDNWFVLVNAPALAEDNSAGMNATDWARFAEGYGDRIIARLETKFGFEDLRAQIRVRRTFTPADFKTRYLAHGGSLYGFASHGVSSAFRRPALGVQGLPGFSFVGGSTHPGGGLPLVCLSARMAAERILGDLARPWSDRWRCEPWPEDKG